jgi:predicted PurR-regulated permease PerM
MLAKKLPESISAVRAELGKRPWLRPLANAVPPPEKIAPGLGKIVAGLPRFFSTTTEAAALILLSIVVGIYAAADPRLYLNSLIYLAPPESRDRVLQVGNRLHTALGWWLVGRIIAMTLMGVLTTIGLLLLNVPMALMLGVISGLFQFVPYVGAFAGSVPGILIGLVQSPFKALEVAVLYLVVHVVEGYFVTPIIQQRAIALPAAALLSVQLIMGALFGIIGIIFATPAAVVVIVLVQTVYLRGIFGDHVSILGQQSRLNLAARPR